MTTLPNPFITNSAPARTSPGVDAAAAVNGSPTTAAANPFLNSAMPTAESAVPSDLPPVIGGTAAPFQSSDGGVDGHAQSHALGLPPKYNRCGKRKPEGAPPEGFGASKDEPAGVEPGPSEAIPASTGGPQEAIAGIAPNTAAPAIALAAPWEDGFWLVLLEVLDIPPIDLHETPLFVREADGFLRRNA